MNNVKEINVRVYDEVITLTKDTIIKTRDWYIDNQNGQVAEVESGEVYLNPDYGLDRLKRECLDNIENIKQGKWDNGFSFIQRAVYIQTKQSVPMLG